MLEMDDFSLFLYRRLARFVTCKVRIPGGGSLWLDDKFQAASFQDVFMDPNYWRAYLLFRKVPDLIVDCGAHCGHFSILAETCIRMRFGEAHTNYILIEPNEDMLPKMWRNMANAQMERRVSIVQGGVGPKKGSAMLRTQTKNLLVSSVASHGEKGARFRYVDVAALIGDRRIDLLKLDVEGAEFSFIEHNHDVLAKTDNVIVEVHSGAGEWDDFDAKLREHGFSLTGPVMEANGNRMATYQRL